MAKYEISTDDPPERWEELFALLAAEAESPEPDPHPDPGLQIAGLFFPSWHVL